MRHLVFEEAGRYAWRDAPEPAISVPEQALVRPVAVACCDLDVGVAQGALPMPAGDAVGHEGIAEVVAVGDGVRNVRVGDRVVVPFQISCGQCRECRRGVTGSCGSLPLMAMYGMAPLAGLDGGGFMADLVLVPYADAMLIPVPQTVDPVAIASLSDNIPDAWRAIGPFHAELAALDESDRRVLVVGRLVHRRVRRRAGVGARRPRRLRRHRPEPTRRRREAGGRRARPRQARQVLGPLSRHRADVRRPENSRRHIARDLARRSLHRHRHLLPGRGRNAAAGDVHPRCAVRHRACQRTGRHPGDSRRAGRRVRPRARRSSRWPTGTTHRRCGRR